MNLHSLISFLPEYVAHGYLSDEIQVATVEYDSRKVTVGSVFVSIVGQNYDGHDYIKQAIERGAVAIVGQRDWLDLGSKEVPYISTPDTRKALAVLAAAFYGFPAKGLKVIGVTGTDGKTTTCVLIRAVLEAAGYSVGMITTLGGTIDGEFMDTGVHVTTPSATEIQSYLAEMVQYGVDYAVIEATSHGLSQSRVHMCEFDVAAITNISHEHLDFHGTFDAYLEAKAILFYTLRDPSNGKSIANKISILNVDDRSYSKLSLINTDNNVTYGINNPADVSATDIQYTQTGTTFSVVTPIGKHRIGTHLLGEHNVYNTLTTIAIAMSQNISWEAISTGIARVRSVPGRMERIEEGQDFLVISDYAHTPNGLRNALMAARKLGGGSLILVCGLSGGNRDVTKRPLFGQVAGQFADKVVLTSMDWYAEHVDSIMSQIARGCEQVGMTEGRDYWRVREREAGIGFAIDLAKAGDIVLIAGKAHETTLSSGAEEREWNEIQVIRNRIRDRLSKIGKE